MKDFTDHFKRQSAIYAQVRPHYPDQLFEFLSSLTPAHDLAWDAGTGNGQAAIGLAKHYQKVIATDPAEEQLKHAYQHTHIEYKVQRAELFDGDVGSMDLITCANALHW